MRNVRIGLRALAVAMVTLLASAPAALAQASATVQIATNAKFGSILTNGQGMTLYYRTSDPAGQSSCTGVCAQNWPPLTVTGTPTPPAGLTGQLTTFARPDGTTQVAYNGHALYTFVGDKAPGDTNGEGIAGVWHVATVSLAPAGGAPAAKPSALPKTGSSPLGYAAGSVLLLAGLALLARRPRTARR